MWNMVTGPQVPQSYQWRIETCVLRSRDLMFRHRSIEAVQGFPIVELFFVRFCDLVD